MLCIISRDGKAVHEFCELHNIDISKVKIIKSTSDLNGCDGLPYVPLKPYPDCYHWSIRPLLSDLKMKNQTRKYNQKIIKF